jgi:hypothetical protein
MIRGDRINRNTDAALIISDGGMGVVEDNDLTGNGRGAWDIAKDSAPIVTRARNKE